MSKSELVERQGYLVRKDTGESIAPIIDGVPRFVPHTDNYAENFGWQWNHFASVRSIHRSSSSGLREALLDRTKYLEYETKDKVILECGMGGGDDTEVIAELPFKEIHAFDLSSAVDRARAYISDPRVIISQASIYDIPYPDNSFDFVHCHRVIQHTPDPEKAMRCVAKKVKPGGVLFIHSYKASRRWKARWHYRYRFLFHRMPRKCLCFYVEIAAIPLVILNIVVRKIPLGHRFAETWIPYQHISAKSTEFRGLSFRDRLEFSKCNTFDAFSPTYDQPMTSEQFKHILDTEGFDIEHLQDPTVSPLYATARKSKPS